MKVTRTTRAPGGILGHEKRADSRFNARRSIRDNGADCTRSEYECIPHAETRLYAIVNHGATGLTAVLSAQRSVETTSDALGVSTNFGRCQQLVAACGTIANFCADGINLDLRLETLRDRRITSTPRLLNSVSNQVPLDAPRSYQNGPDPLTTYGFTLKHALDAYEVLAHVGKNKRALGTYCNVSA